MPKGDAKADESAQRMSGRTPIVTHFGNVRHACRGGTGHGHAADPSKAQVDDLRAVDDDVRSDKKEESS